MREFQAKRNVVVNNQTVVSFLFVCLFVCSFVCLFYSVVVVACEQALYSGGNAT